MWEIDTDFYIPIFSLDPLWPLMASVMQWLGFFCLYFSQPAQNAICSLTWEIGTEPLEPCSFGFQNHVTRELD